jgi:hypothetical protein
MAIFSNSLRAVAAIDLGFEQRLRGRDRGDLEVGNTERMHVPAEILDLGEI